MPLNARKVAHIRANLVKVFSGRTQAIVLTLAVPGGGTTTKTVNGIWRPTEDQDPTYDPTPVGGTEAKIADAIGMFQLADLPYQTARSILYVELAVGQPGPAFASRYLPTSIQVKGMVPGGDRLIMTFDRQRA